jgi:hypothetical protein
MIHVSARYRQNALGAIAHGLVKLWRDERSRIFSLSCFRLRVLQRPFEQAAHAVFHQIHLPDIHAEGFGHLRRRLFLDRQQVENLVVLILPKNPPSLFEALGRAGSLQAD